MVSEQVIGAKLAMSTFYCVARKQRETKRQFLKMIQPIIHTAGLDTIFIQIYMDALPGVPGVSKNQNFFFTYKTVQFLH